MIKKIGLTLFLLTFLACSNVPISNRKQISLVSNTALISESEKSYSEIISKSVIVTDDRATKVKMIGSKLEKAVVEYLTEINKVDLVKDFKWEFNLIEENTVNAWCMPGGKVAFYTGILPFTVDDAGIAAVMGHEIAHAIANHGNERVSQSILISLGYEAFDKLKKDNPSLLKEVLYQSYGVASTLGSLKFSRVQELEADKMGLIFMALAGYDPNTSIGFWERMSKNGGANIELLSTHPSDEKRIAEIKSYLPEAMKYYKK